MCDASCSNVSSSRTFRGGGKARDQTAGVDDEGSRRRAFTYVGDQLGVNYSTPSRYELAAKLELQLLEIRTRLSGEEHPDTLTIMGNPALNYHK